MGAFVYTLGAFVRKRQLPDAQISFSACSWHYYQSNLRVRLVASAWEELPISPLRLRLGSWLS